MIWEQDQISENVIGRCKPAADALELGESVTALAFAPKLFGRGYLLAVGMECGVISTFEWKKESAAWGKLLVFNREYVMNFCLQLYIYVIFCLDGLIILQ